MAYGGRYDRVGQTGQAGTSRVCPGKSRAGQGRDKRDTPFRGGVPFVPTHVPDLPDRLAELAHRVGRLSPSHREPERYHEEKSEIAFELRVLARHVSTR